MKSKCKVCHGCLTPTWILDQKRVFWCFLCQKYYDIVDGVLVEVNKEEIEEKIRNEAGL